MAARSFGSKRLREKFPVGARVRLTQKGFKQRLYGWDAHRAHKQFGTVVGYGASPDTTKPCAHIRVIRDGNKSAEPYHEKFWECVEVMACA